jgi:hypothetical protein
LTRRTLQPEEIKNKKIMNRELKIKMSGFNGYITVKGYDSPANNRKIDFKKLTELLLIHAILEVIDL